MRKSTLFFWFFVFTIFCSASLLQTKLAQAASPTATVNVASLNVRNGPGTHYAVIGSVKAGEQLSVAGQVNNCAWLQVVTAQGTAGWVSGAAKFVTLGQSCKSIALAAAPAPPPATKPATAPPPPAALSSSQGCYLFQNQLGADVNITLTRRGDGWSKTFLVARNSEQAQCFDPGNYTYTLDAPPPWNSINGEIKVSAGDRYQWPIRGE